jgi:hypothetical protein
MVLWNVNNHLSEPSYIIYEKESSISRTFMQRLQRRFDEVGVDWSQQILGEIYTIYLA